ncbi:CopY family transcriptional repressor [Natranaerovirga pectinivora]|uniref:CopY family transcriptional repressor n=1 Tax=Natranaerovirga pectinivora TaxID=682400 RepID=A0A4V2V0D2_9FIRM|nr:BlaI/MecI/CopY family transcriptional regulator [Natranaerovirga pectinivora]TCT15430.1 CopY family transcriptional repressor [Natranaerovirga pectinivora]
MKAIPQISESELEVMKILWEVGDSTSANIVEVLTNRTDWKDKTVYTLINRLVAKGAIKAEKTDGKAYIYSPSISEIDYQEFANNSFIQKVYNGSVKMMLTSFVKEHKITKEDIDNLKRILDEED